MHKKAFSSPHHVPAVAAPRERFVEQQVEGPDGIVRTVRVHIGESPLSWLRARGLLAERLYLAGDRLREDWERAGLGARVTMAWNIVPGGQRRSGQGRSGQALDPGARQIAAKRCFDEALRHSGPGLCDILWRVVCAGEGLAAAEKALGWPSRAGKLVLGFALERVADYYRIA
ncbi:MAG: DUF6456 domain-containing protein [Sphingobium sp.]